ncbi:MAG: patatin-like phospholipase family protein [Bacteroidales bacterium]|nr:patatin-like phospholipase family protein [Bacteroidales bacterium]
MVSKFWVYLLVASLCVLSARAQKVAVVLSGGGAKGVCHIGLLKALEENNIPIDYVAGTSMGAIVAGLYAAGYTPQQMEEIMKSEEFDRWAKGEISPEYYYYYKRDEENARWVSIRLRIKDDKLKPRLPSNIVAPYEMDYQFVQIFAEASAAARYNFDSLMVPFRCVASDIAANKPYVPVRGSLENAVRASMTFPFYFKPITIDGRLLFDGGMYNNFPVDIAIRDFKPDYVIGCKAAGDYAAPDPNDVLSQLENMLMTKIPYEIPAGQKGIIISPALLPVAVNDFSNTPAFIDSGYVATLRVIDSIKMYVTRRVSQEERAEKRDKFNRRKPPMFIDTIYVNGVNPSQADYIRSMLHHVPGQRMFQELKPEYFKLIADERVRHVFPRVHYNPKTGLYNLTLEAELNDPIEMGFGGLITSGPNTEGYLEAKYHWLGQNASSLSFNTFFGRFHTSGTLVGRIDFPDEFPWFTEAAIQLNRYNYFPVGYIFLDDILSSNLTRFDRSLSLAAGWPITNHGVFKVTGTLGEWGARYFHTNAIKKDDTQDKSTLDYFSARFILDFSSLNYRQYPTAGSRFKTVLAFTTGNENHLPGSTSVQTKPFEDKHAFMDLKLTYDNYFAKIGRANLGAFTELYISTRPFLNNYTASMLLLPQIELFPAMNTLVAEKFRSNSYVAGGLKSVLPLGAKIHWRSEVYFYQHFRKLFQDKDQKAFYGPWFSHNNLAFTTAVVAHSVLGPISLNLNYIQGESSPWFITFNLGYVIFNKGGLDF